MARLVCSEPVREGIGDFTEVRNQDRLVLEVTRLPVYLIHERLIIRPFLPTFALLLFPHRFFLGLPDFLPSGTAPGIQPPSPSRARGTLIPIPHIHVQPAVSHANNYLFHPTITFKRFPSIPLCPSRYPTLPQLRSDLARWSLGRSVLSLRPFGLLEEHGRARVSC